MRTLVIFLFIAFLPKFAYSNFETTYSLKRIGTIATPYSDEMTYHAPVKVVIIKDPLIKSFWNYGMIEQRIEKAANVFRQCNLGLSQVDVYELELLNREMFEYGTEDLKQAVTVNEYRPYHPYRSLNSLALSKAVESLAKSQVIFYSKDVCGGYCNAFSGTYSQIPYSERIARNKVWIGESAASATDLNASYITEAHELGHNLLNDPTHFDDNQENAGIPLYNIMSTGEGRSGEFTQEQCSRILKSPSVKKKK